MSRIELEEYGTFPPKQGDAGQEPKKIKNLKQLQLEEKDLKLMDELKGILTIVRDPVKKTLRFTAHSRIGVAQFSNFEVAVTPKLQIRKIVEMINYTDDLDLKTFEEGEIRFAGKSGTLTEIIITAFVEECRRLLRHGMFRSYNLQEDDLPVWRGKLIIPRQILNQANARLRLACEYDEFEYNNLENRIILFGLKRSYYVTTSKEQKTKIRRLIQNFSGLMDFQEIRRDDFSKINYNQMNAHYKKIHTLCKLIVDNTQITDLYEQKLRFVNSFFIDMNRVFEKFVTKLFMKHYPLSVKGQYRYSLWKSNLKGSIKSIPDILVKEEGGKKIHAVIDAKYKEDIVPEDLYQMEHYMHDHKKMEAYMILPEFETSKSDIYTSEMQGIRIKIRHINIDRMLDLINNKDSEVKNQQITDLLLEIIQN